MTAIWVNSTEKQLNKEGVGCNVLEFDRIELRKWSKNQGSFINQWLIESNYSNGSSYFLKISWKKKKRWGLEWSLEREERWEKKWLRIVTEFYQILHAFFTLDPSIYWQLLKWANDADYVGLCPLLLFWPVPLLFLKPNILQAQ